MGRVYNTGSASSGRRKGKAAGRPHPNSDHQNWHVRGPSRSLMKRLRITPWGAELERASPEDQRLFGFPKTRKER
jgi:hypothetical protein